MSLRGLRRNTCTARKCRCSVEIPKQSLPKESVLGGIIFSFDMGRLLRCGAPCASPRNDILIFLLSSLLLFSCSTGPPPATSQVVTVYSTSAAQPWLDPLYKCAESRAVISRVADPISADIILRIGEPEFLDLSAYQIDHEDILLVTNHQSPVQNLTLEETRA